MKKVSAFLLSLIILAPVAGFSGPVQNGVKNWITMFGTYYGSLNSSSSSSSDEVSQDSNIELSIKNRTLFINGRQIASPWDLQAVVNAIGQYDRVSNLANNIYTYDSKGILLYEAPNTSKVSEINIGWITESYDFSSKTTFSGVFMIDNVRYSPSTTIDEVKKNLAGYKIEKAYGDSYRVSLGGIYIYFNYDPSTMKIIYVAFGPEK